MVDCKEEDFLNADQLIPGQNFVCLSFVSPEKILKDKHLFKLMHFLKTKYEIEKTYEEIDEDYKCFLVNNDQPLEKKFYEDQGFHTTVRGLKVRGVYDTQKEAAFRAKTLRKLDPSHNIFVGQVGRWLPWDPEPFDVQNMEYAEPALNTLMKSKRENELKKDMHFAEEKQKRVEDAIKYGKEIPKDNFEDGLYKDDPWTKKQKDAQKTDESTTEESKETTETTETTDSSKLSKEDEDELSKAIDELEK